MMTVILSNGEKLQMAGYEPVTVQVDGDTTNGVRLSLVDIDEEHVRTLLSDMSNFAEVEVYSESNIFKESLSGYQQKVSVALGENPGSYVITLAQGTDTTSRVKSLAKDVAELSTSVATTLETIKEFVEKLTAMDPKVTELNVAYGETTSKVEEYVKSTNELLKEFAEIKSSIESSASIGNAVSSREKQLTAQIDSVLQVNESLQSQLTEAVTCIKDIYAHADELYATYTQKISSLEQVRTLAKETKELCAENDNNVQLAVGKTEKIDSALEEYKGAIAKQNAKFEENQKVVTEAAEVAKNIDSRVAALEPVTDISILPLDEAKRVKIIQSQKALAEFLEANPITSTCHGNAAQYSITAEKQSYLQSMILIATSAEASGIEYQPSWNAVGEPCTYDWTVPQLQQLAMEIEAVVRPIVSQQQNIERIIRNCNDMDELVAVEINYTVTNKEV